MNRERMIAKLQGTRPPSVVLVDEQTVSDIIKSMQLKHVQCAGDYDKIAGEFDKGDIYEVCEQLWKFCKQNFRYNEEDVEKQFTSCPYTILSGGVVDCKNYSLFIGGVLDALKRRGRSLDWRYRFASYDLFDFRPGHVFVVVNENTDNIWIDPVLDQFNYHLFYWYKRDKQPKMATIGRVPMARVGSAGDDLQQQLIEYSEGVAGAYQQTIQTGTINTVTEKVLQSASSLVPEIKAGQLALGQIANLIGNTFGPYSEAARLATDLANLNVVGFFGDLFSGTRTYQQQGYWAAAMYHFYVLGQSNITNQNQMADGDVWPALRWFIDRTGVYISGTELLQALTISTDKYLSYYNVNKGVTTDRARVDAAVAVAKQYWSNAPINPGDAPGNFAPGTAGSWANTIGVFDQGIAQIASSQGLTPEQYVHQTGIDYTVNPTGVPAGQLIPGFDNIWIIAGFGALVLIDLLNE